MVGARQVLVLVVASVFARGRVARAAEPRPEDAPSDGQSDDEVQVRGSAAAGFSTRAEESSSVRDLGDAASLLEPIPGVHVRRLGADSSFSTLSIRGSTSDQVSVFFAGVPLAGGSDPTLDLSSLPLVPGMRARVYRSFVPGSLGPSALGGALALDPASLAGGARAGTKTEVYAGGGSLGAARVRASDSRPLPLGEARLETAITTSRADGDFSYFDPILRRDVVRANAGHADAAALVVVTRPLPLGGGAEGRLRITSLASFRRQHLPGTIFAPTSTDSLYSTRSLTSLLLDLPLGRSEADPWLLLKAWHRRDSVDVRTGRSALGAPGESDDAFVAYGGRAGWKGPIAKGMSADVGLDGSGERFAPGERTGAFSPASPVTRVLGGASLDLDAKVGRRLRLAGAGRVDARSDSQAGGDPGRGNVDRDLRPIGHLGAELGLAEGLTVAAHGGALARPPSFLERFGNRGLFLPNPALRTESAVTVDGGLRAARKRRGVSLDGQIVAFQTWATDLITFVAVGAGGKPKASNVGQARISGLEAEGSAGWRSTTAHASYTFLATANETSCTVGVGVRLSNGPASCERPPLPGRPAHDLVIDAAQGFGPATIRYGVDVVAGMFADAVGTVPVPARALHSAGLRVDVPWVPGLRVAADVKNLFDLRTSLYADLTGETRLPIGDSYDFPLAGRTFFVSARWTHEEPAPSP